MDFTACARGVGTNSRSLEKVFPLQAWAPPVEALRWPGTAGSSAGARPTSKEAAGLYSQRLLRGYSILEAATSINAAQRLKNNTSDGVAQEPVLVKHRKHFLVGQSLVAAAVGACLPAATRYSGLRACVD